MRSIEKGVLRLPIYLSPDAGNLITALLNRNPAQRIGSGKTGAAEIKQHAWFKDIDWDLALRRGLKPLKPCIKPVPNVVITPDFNVDADRSVNHLPGWGYTDKHAI